MRDFSKAKPPLHVLQKQQTMREPSGISTLASKNGLTLKCVEITEKRAETRMFPLVPRPQARPQPSAFWKERAGKSSRTCKNSVKKIRCWVLRFREATHQLVTRTEAKPATVRHPDRSRHAQPDRRSEGICFSPAPPQTNSDAHRSIEKDSQGEIYKSIEG
jgi:hypothetical protein